MRIVLVLALLLTTGCHHDSKVYNASLPPRFCHQVLIDALNHDATPVPEGAPPVVQQETLDGLVLLDLATGCAHGASLAVLPPGAARVTNRVLARDGAVAAVVLRPALLFTCFDVAVSRPDGHRDVVRVRLGTSQHHTTCRRPRWTGPATGRDRP